MKIEERIKLIIKLIMERENMTTAIFADSIGAKTSTISHVLTDRNRPSLDVITKIHQKYNYINLEWLVHGTGEMMNEKHATSVDSSAPSSTTTTTPLYSDQNFPSLFDQNPENTTVEPENSKNRKEMPLETPVSGIKPSVIHEIKYIERPPRKITEIRIFFDDNTYETFRGEK